MLTEPVNMWERLEQKEAEGGINRKISELVFSCQKKGSCFLVVVKGRGQVDREHSRPNIGSIVDFDCHSMAWLHLETLDCNVSYISL